MFEETIITRIGETLTAIITLLLLSFILYHLLV
jgi:hypothetical protein